MDKNNQQVQWWLDFSFNSITNTIYIGDPDNDDGDIGPKTSAEAIKAIHLLDRGKTAENTITVLINSSGGSVFDGLAIYDTLTACKSFVHTHTIGQCCSIAMAILQAGDTRTASPNSWLMVHDGQAEDGKIDTRDVDSLKYITDRQKWQYYSILAGKSKLSTKDWEEKCRSDYWMSAQDALELELIDEVKNI